jgi:hypothetical protein
MAFTYSRKPTVGDNFNSVVEFWLAKTCSKPRFLERIVKETCTILTREHVPTDIWAMIFSLLNYHTFVACSLVCHYWNRIVKLPLAWEHCMTWSGIAWIALESVLLRNCLSDPSVLKKITELEYPSHSIRNITHSEAITKVSLKTLDLTSFIYATCLDRHKWKTCFQRNLPNLETLRITEQIFLTEPDLSVRKRKGPTAQTFDQLRSLRFTFSRNENLMNKRDWHFLGMGMTNLLRNSKNLTSLSTYCVWDIPSLLKDKPKLEHLEITQIPSVSWHTPQERPWINLHLETWTRLKSLTLGSRFTRDRQVWWTLLDQLTKELVPELETLTLINFEVNVDLCAGSLAFKRLTIESTRPSKIVDFSSGVFNRLILLINWSSRIVNLDMNLKNWVEWDWDTPECEAWLKQIPPHLCVSFAYGIPSLWKLAFQRAGHEGWRISDHPGSLCFDKI